MKNFDLSKIIKDLLGDAKNMLDVFAEKQKKAYEQKNGLLKTEFENIDKKYRESAGIPELKKMEYTPPSDSEIEETVKNQLFQKASAEKDKIADTISKAFAALEEDREKATEKTAAEIQNTEKAYDNIQKTAHNKAVKQGIARSSVAEESQKLIEEEKENLKTSLSEELYGKLDEIDKGIKELETKKEKAIADFDLSYASELESKIKSLQKERASKMDEVLKYNNTIAEKEEKYLRQMEKDGITALMSEEKIAAAKKYFENMPKQKAVEELKNNDIFKKHLGNYYNYMLNYLQNKA